MSCQRLYKPCILVTDKTSPTLRRTRPLQRLPLERRCERDHLQGCPTSECHYGTPAALAKGSLYGRMISLTVNRRNYDAHMMRHSATACNECHRVEAGRCAAEKLCERLKYISVRARGFSTAAALQFHGPSRCYSYYSSDERRKGESKD